MIRMSSPLALLTPPPLITLSTIGDSPPPPKEKYHTCGAGNYGGCAPTGTDASMQLPSLGVLNGGTDVAIPTAPFFALELDLDTHRPS